MLRKSNCEMKVFWLLALAPLVCAGSAVAQTKSAPVEITVQNFTRAESDLYMRNLIKDGRLGALAHRREPARIENQSVIRLNRDTLYSSAVFDLDAGPATITMPDAGKRFMSLQIICEDHYVPVVYYGPGVRTLDRENVGTRYVVAAIRTLVDPADPKDVDQVHRLQDAIRVEQKSPGKFEAPNWDPASQREIRDALLSLAGHTGGLHARSAPEDRSIR